MSRGVLSALRLRFVLFATLTILPVLILIVYTAWVRRQLDGRELSATAVHAAAENESGGFVAPPSERESPISKTRVETTRGAGALSSSIGRFIDEAAAAEETHSNSAGAQQTLWRHGWIAAMALWLVFVGAWLRSNLFILHRVEALATAAKRIVSGDLRARVALPQNKDELSQLAADFDAMAAALQLKDEETKRLEPQKSNAGLERSNQAESDFLSLMSHELRTPLSLIIGYAGMMQDGLLGQVTAEQRNSLEQIMRCSDELLALVMSILQATSIESGVIRIQSDEFDPHDLFAELRSDCGPAKERRFRSFGIIPITCRE